jgi:2,3-bisphosphoglycerate-dependent phosphoglycerate mutase
VLDRLTRDTILDAEIATGAALIYDLNADSTVASKTVLLPELG